MRSATIEKSSLAWFLGAATLFVASGCSQNSWQAGAYPVTGKVTVNGEPAAGAMIKLIKLGEPVDSRKSEPWALVESDGTYQMTTYEHGDGAPRGEYAWLLRWPPNSMQMAPDRLGEEYWNLEDPYMTVTIEGPTELPPVELSNVQLRSP